MHSISRKFDFDAAHRVYGHESKCANLHGHRYVAWVHVQRRRPEESDKLDHCSRLIDFGVIKNIIGKWIDEQWDHNTLLSKEDPLARWLDTEDQWPGVDPFPSKTLYIMKNGNPTAENIAKELLEQSNILLGITCSLYVWKVEVFETPNCSAIYESHADALTDY